MPRGLASRLPFAIFGTTDPVDIAEWTVRYIELNYSRSGVALLRNRHDNLRKTDLLVQRGLADGRSPDIWQQVADDQMKEREELIHDMCAYLNKQRPSAVFGRIPGTAMNWGWYAKEVAK